ncbi:hypothetical protein PROFUN_08334 [Planoprotostelium fungivorum]|uniref:Uncharacterized protein n=1 Tax=Planoprotostelium fungivorum TaxID=1890364 RepID=A0A2P6NI19_9EUKA|nr:hypothetical protein PROFUN_08334 [Planoprotostelium fungivorum]
MLRVLAQRSTLCRLSGLTRLPQIANRKSSTETYLAEIVSKKTEVLQKEAKSMEFAQKKLPLALEIDKLLSSKKRRDLDPFMNTTSRLVDKYEKGEITFEGEEKDLVASIAVMGQNAVLGPVVISAVVMNRYEHFKINSEMDYKQHTEQSYVAEHWNAPPPGLDITSVVYTSPYIDEQAALGVTMETLMERGTKLLLNWIEKVKRGTEQTTINGPMEDAIKLMGEDLDKKLIHVSLHPALPKLHSHVKEKFPDTNTEDDAFLTNYAYWTAFYRRKELLEAAYGSQLSDVRVGTGYTDSIYTQKFMVAYKEQTPEELEVNTFTPLRMSNPIVNDFMNGRLTFDLPLEPSENLNKTLSELGGSYNANRVIEDNDLLRHL